MKLKTEISILCGLIFIMGFSSGMIIGEYRQMDYTRNIMAITEERDGLIEFSGTYYTVEKFEPCTTLDCYTNLSINISEIK